MVHAFIWLLATCNVLSSDAIDTIKLHNYLKRETGLLPTQSVPNASQPDIVTPEVVLYGVQVEGADHSDAGDINEIPKAVAGSRLRLEVYASGLTPQTYLALSESNETCDELSTKAAQVELSASGRSGQAFINIPEDVPSNVLFYFCAKTNGSWHHLGSEVLGVTSGPFPLYVQIIIMFTCLVISFIFSALNLGLMALDVNELQMLINSGTNVEQRYARRILPVRRNGNYLLCCILLCLTLTNAIFTTILDSLTSGLVAVIGTTITLVIIGEILPQSIGSRYGLAIGAHTIYLTRLAMLITFPLSYPMGKALDCLLGEEIGSIKTRENLKALVMATSNLVALKKDEVNIISGALEMTQKKVEEIMTKLDDCYMLDIETILNFTVISEIVRTGYSRVPVYEEKRTKIVSVLFTKDMAVIDPDDNIPLKTLCKFMPYEIYSVPVGTTLDILFKNFKDGIKGHMAFVHKTDHDGEDITVGLVTLEDVIEEIIQAEIVDESDMYEDNRSSRRRTHRRLMQEFMKYSENFGKQQVRISPQLILAAYQFLCTEKRIGRKKLGIAYQESVQPFLPEYISPTVLWRMLQYDIYRQVKPNETEDSVIYQEGKSADYFVMILEGRVTVKVGIEQLEFESGPFTCFGTHALIREMGTGDAQTATPSGIPSTPTANRLRVGSLGTVSDAIGFCPDYTVVASTELSYLTINRELYAAGRNATQIERSRQRAKMRGEGASVSFPSSPMLPRDDRFSALYLANSTESLATAHERRDSKRITFKDEERTQEMIQSVQRIDDSGTGKS
ncbi:hypothetical protein M8J77_007683 [Diaphorina citri]|nr:hypothetical protein M8J77_007683 [Diaphorina citri]